MKSRILVAGIGNIFRADDGFGVNRGSGGIGFLLGCSGFADALERQRLAADGDRHRIAVED